MSLILDALKRAERERRAGQAPPPLEPVAVPAEAREARDPHRWLLPALVGAVVAGAAVYGYLRLRPAASTAGVAPVTATAAPSTPAPAVPAPVAPPPASPEAMSTAEPAAAGAAVDDARIATLDDLVDGGRGPGRDTERAPRTPADTGVVSPRGDAESRGRAAPAAAEAASEPLPPFEQPVGPPPADAPPPPTTAAVAPPPAAPATSTPPATAAPEPADGAAASGRSLKEMSPNFRADFPTLTVDVHVYNDDPQRRFAIVNGKRYREGDTLAEGPRLVGIVADGLLLEWRGERVVYTLPR